MPVIKIESKTHHVSEDQLTLSANVIISSGEERYSLGKEVSATDYMDGTKIDEAKLKDLHDSIALSLKNRIIAGQAPVLPQ